ncbi:MAG: MerR family transcriptional regulator [Dehalococcoidia bacterium]|nr:MerR family transcriptional regulator [Dehalococcoidia bacterium]
MLKIGEFSRLSQVPVSTLRYYDEIGLLKPVQVDDFTGYRYYTAEQFPKLSRITVLKDLGLSLTEIVQLTSNGTSTAVLRDALNRKQAESMRAIEIEKGRLQRLEAWLENLASGTTMEEYEVTIKKTDPQQLVCLRRVMPSYHSEGELWRELCTYLGTLKGVQYAGPAMNICHDSEYREKDVDIEVALPVAVAVPESGDIKVRTLDGEEQVASVLHKGPFDSIIRAYQFIVGWIERNNYRMAGPDRVLYLNNPEEVAPDEIVEELQIPIARP